MAFFATAQTNDLAARSAQFALYGLHPLDGDVKLLFKKVF